MTKIRHVSARAKPRQGGIIDDVLKNGVDDTQIVNGLARGLSILSAFRRNDSSLGNAELSERTGLNKSTVSRMTYTLALHDYLAFNAHTREYSLGPQVIALGALALATTNVRTLAIPIMRQLAKEGSFNVGLGTQQGLQMVYTDAMEGGGLVGLRLYPGSRLPIATSAMGKAYLAGIDKDQRAVLMQHLETHYADDWPRIRKGIEAALVELRTKGYCSSIGDWQPDIHGVAVPIAALPGSPVYVLNLGGPAYLLPEADLHEQFAPRLVAAVRQIESALGS